MNGRRFDMLAAGMLVVLLLAALHMISAAVQRSEDLGQWFMPLLLFSVVGLVLLFALVGWNLWQLLRDYRRRVAGSRLSARLSVMFLVLALLPVSVVYFYSIRFLSSGIDSWFDLQVDSAMEDALTLSKLSLDLSKRERLKLTKNLLNAIEDTSQTAMALNIGEMRNTAGATEMALFSMQGKLLAMVTTTPRYCCRPRRTAAWCSGWSAVKTMSAWPAARTAACWCARWSSTARSAVSCCRPCTRYRSRSAT